MKYTSSYQQELSGICSDIKIQSAEEFSFRDVPSNIVRSQPTIATRLTHVSENPELALNAVMINSICKRLYNQCYVRNYAQQSSREKTALDEDQLSHLFAQANHSQDGWDHGWQIYQTDSNGRLFVQKGDRSRAVLAGEYTTYKWPGVRARSGDFVSVRRFTGSEEVQQQFFFAFGKTLSDQFDDYTLVRFYFNIESSVAVLTMSLVTTLLNRYLIPFKFKSLVNASAYTRADSAVLYVAKRYYHIVASLMTDLSKKLEDGLREGTPMFTKELLPGIGVADDPGNNLSFGMHRCQLVAAGIVSAWNAGSQEVEAKMGHVQQQFSAIGVTIDQPYLNSNSINIFEEPVFLQETQW